MEGSSTHLRCSVRIDLCALERNLGKLRFFMPKSRGYIALVSADAFGYGVEAAVVRLMLSGADAFAVTNISEAIKVREVGSGWKIIVLSASIPSEEHFYFQNDITPVIAGLEELERFENTAKQLNKKLKVHLKLPVEKDSIPSNSQAKQMLERILQSEYLSLEAFCLSGTGTGAPSEGAIADTNFLDFAAKTLGKNSGVYIHHSDICNTSALPNEFEKSLRAGLVLFGMRPAENSILRGFEPEHVLTFRTSVSQIKYLPKGATVGYSKTYTLERDSRIALLSVGYGDGIPRESSKKISVIIRGKKADVIGRVSMDQAVIDVTDFDEIELGDEAIIVGQSDGLEITIEQYCQRLGITPAQALTSITKRVARFYKTLY
ncbi:MAG: alanine racemase [Verrucomicrobiaceae bacterium]|nr:alanine racemase [Verrucomicrobiaceae bacterium]